MNNNEKKTGARLSEREATMIVVLLIVVAVALSSYFLLLPMYANLPLLRGEAEELEAAEAEHREQIALTPDYKKLYDEARTEYLQYSSYFYPLMDPESIDERITGMLVAHGLEPISLSMPGLDREDVPMYAAQELRANPVPLAQAPAEEPAGSEGTNDSQLGQMAEVADALAPTRAEPQGGVSAYVYTVNVSAEGDRDKLFAFLAQASALTAFEVTRFDYTDPVAAVSEKGAGGKTVVVTPAVPGLVNMEIKLYVFASGGTNNG